MYPHVLSFKMLRDFVCFPKESSPIQTVTVSSNGTGDQVGLRENINDLATAQVSFANGSHARMCVFVSVALSYSRGLSLPAAGAVVKFLLSFILLLLHADQQQFVGVNTHTHAEISQEKESTKFKITTEKEKVRV